MNSNVESTVPATPEPAPPPFSFAVLLADVGRFLSFRPPSPALLRHWPESLGFGLVVTWLAGIGRYWDNPRAELWQLAGLGSVAYVLVLSSLLWLLIAPLRPKHWSFRNVLLFVTLTSPPALLYAIPVERFLDMNSAARVNAWFLAIVAMWRVALYANFLRRVARLALFPAVVATVLPLALIIVVLAMLNLEHVVFSIMSGISPSDVSANDSAYQIVVITASLSILASPVLLLAYLGSIYHARLGRW